MNKFKFINIAFFLILLTLLFIPSYSRADTPTQIIQAGDDFLNRAGNDSLFNEDNERNAVDQIYNIALAIGIAVVIIVGIVLGIQYITTGVIGQAKVKEKLIPFAIGAFVIFGALGIWRIALSLTSQVLGNPNTI